VSQLLSKDEVDALLKGVSEGGVPDGGTRGTGRVVPIDLTTQERNLRGRYPGLDLAIDRLARSLRTTVGAILGKLPAIDVTALELVKFTTVTARLAPPVSVQFFRMPPLKGQGLIVVPAGLAALLFEAFLGGDARRRTALPAREFSAIEQRVLERLGTRILHDLREACRPLGAIEFALVGSERGTMLASVAAPQDLVLLIDLAVAVEGEEPVSVSLCIPNAALDPIRRALDAKPGLEREVRASSWSDRLRELIAPLEVELVAELGSQRLRLADVLALKAGDLLTLRTGREGPVLVRVEGRPVFTGAPGVAGNSNAVRVTAAV